MSRFRVKTNIDGSTFLQNLQFYDTVSTYLASFSADLDQLEICTHIIGTYHVSYEIYSRIKSWYGGSGKIIHIHDELTSFINRYLNIVNNLNNRSVIPPRFGILGESIFSVRGNQLYVKSGLVHGITSDEKRIISALYGEGIAHMMLCEYENVSPFGILKINSSSKTSPDFMVIDNNMNLAMLAEVKTSINVESNRDAKRQLSGGNNGLGIKISLNSYQGQPINITLIDPDYEIEGEFVTSIIWNMALLEVVWRRQVMNVPSIMTISNRVWAESVLRDYYDYILSESGTFADFEKFSIEEGKLYFANDSISRFMKKYLSIPESNVEHGFNRIFRY